MFAAFRFVAIAVVVLAILTGIVQAISTGKISSTGATRHGTPVLFWSQIAIGVAFAGLVVLIYLGLVGVPAR